MSLEVVDWRRRVHALYSTVRSSIDPAAAHRIWVHGRNELLRTHPASPVPAEQRDDYRGATVAPYDSAFRFIVPMQPADPESLEIATGTDGVVHFTRIGQLELSGVGSLDVWWLSSYGGGIFVPIRDPDPGSYGGGRYLLDTVKGADLGEDEQGMVIDLNFAYQPSCAYDPAWVCPLAGPGNTVSVPIPVGERYDDRS